MSDYAAFAVPGENTSQSVAVTTSSAQSTSLKGGDAIVLVSALCFVSRASAAASDGTSLALAANIPHRLMGIQWGDKLAFITATGTATAYITQGV